MTTRRLAVLALAWAGCSSGARIDIALRVPPGDAPLAGADEVALSLRDAAGRVIAFQRAAASAADLSVSGVPAARGLTLVLEASFGADLVARGQSCPFDVGTTPPAGVPLYFSRLGRFAAAASPATARTGAALFPFEGGLLLAGGDGGAGALDSTERFDPLTGSFAPGPTLDEPRAGLAAAVLRSGTVLLFGGGPAAGAGVAALTSASILPVPSFVTPDLVEAAAALLGDGSVLLTGGHETGLAPNTLTWRVSAGGTLVAPGPPLARARARHTITTTGDDRFAFALIAGGRDDTGQPVGALELYDPDTVTFAPAGALAVPRFDHTATRLASGRILIAGGRRADGGVEAAAELFDPVTRVILASGSLRTARARHSAVRLPDGRVLLTGGEDADGNPIADAEIYDPTLGDAGDFVPTASLTTARAGHLAAPLCDGGILITGGGGGAEIYNPFP